MTYRWTPPDPRQLPDWRADLAEYTGSMDCKLSLRMSIAAGRANLLPVVPGLNAGMESVAADLLTRCEAKRLSDAALYYVTADMTALALAAAQTPPVAPMSLDVLPSPTGLIMFAEPIGGYTEDIAASMEGTDAYLPGAARAEIDQPIVAASWSLWDPREIEVQGAPPIRWHWAAGHGTVIPPDFEGVWVTWYSRRGVTGLPPDAELFRAPDGRIVTAAVLDAQREIGPLLTWDNEQVIRTGAKFRTPEADTTEEWWNVLYTAWQLMAQDGRHRWVETEEMPRERAGRKRDTRAGIRGDSGVRIVRVHATHQPARAAAEQDAAQSTGRRAPSWSHRWPVRPHRRQHCMNPALHQDNGCTHEERIITGYVKGPAGAPLRAGKTVNLWDRQPEETPS